MKNDFTQLGETYEIMRKFEKPWFICGGWAIDLALGRKTREHKDIDIGIFRDDQLNLRKYLNDWEFSKVIPDSHEIIQWKEGEYLEKPFHETRASKDKKEIEFLLNDSDNSSWIFRRNHKVRFPKDKLIRYREGIPYWAPEVSLLYKSKGIRPNDQQDFEVILNKLSPEEISWLKNAIEVTHPGHEWIDVLKSKINL